MSRKEQMMAQLEYICECHGIDKSNLEAYRIGVVMAEWADANPVSFLINNEDLKSILNAACFKAEDKLAKANERIELLRNVLTSIASPNNPKENTEAYWLSVSHSNCAETLAIDTHIAREALSKDDEMAK